MRVILLVALLAVLFATVQANSCEVCKAACEFIKNDNSRDVCKKSCAVYCAFKADNAEMSDEQLENVKLVAKKIAQKAKKSEKKTEKKHSPKKTEKKTTGKKTETLNKLLNKKVSPKRIAVEKKKVAAIAKRLVAKAQRQAMISKLPIKVQTAIAEHKLAKRHAIMKKMLNKITPAAKNDDAEKKLFKSIIREFVTKDLLKTQAQTLLLKKLSKKEKKGSKKPSKKGSKKPSKKAAKKVIAMADAEGPYCNNCNAACDKVPAAYPEVKAKCLAACKTVCDRNLSDSEFLGSVGKKIWDKTKEVAKNVAVGAGRGAINGAIAGAKEGFKKSF